MIVAERFPWYMMATAGVGAVGLITGVGTLTDAFTPVFGAWALGAAVLLDALALSLTVWAISAVRDGLPATAPRLAAHGCVVASVAAQAVTAFTGLGHGPGGWISAILHTIPPLVLCLALELITLHYVGKHRARVAPQQAMATLREQVARAATGLGVDVRKCSRAVVDAAKADVIRVEDLSNLLDPEEVKEVPAMRALCAVTGHRTITDRPAIEHRPNADRSAIGHLTTETVTDRPVTVQAPVSVQPERPAAVRRPFAELTKDEKRSEIVRLRADGMSFSAIAKELGCSKATVSSYLSEPTSASPSRVVGFAPGSVQ